MKRFTVNLGLRFDIQDDEALAAEVAANPILPTILPAVSFPGADANVTRKNLSPRLGMTYDLSGTGRTVPNSSFATYYGQMAPGQLSGELAATGAVFVRYPWADTNGDGFVQAGEVTPRGNRSAEEQYNPANPSNFLSPGTVDPTSRTIAPTGHRRHRRRDHERPRCPRQLHLAQGRQLQLAGPRRPDERRCVPVPYTATTCPGTARCEQMTYSSRPSRFRRSSCAPTSPTARATSTASS